jgi:hypothetical protein
LPSWINWGGVAASQQHKLYRAFDADRNGSVDFEELCAGLTSMLAGSTRQKLRLFFDMFVTTDDEAPGTAAQRGMSKYNARMHAPHARLMRDNASGISHPIAILDWLRRPFASKQTARRLKSQPIARQVHNLHDVHGHCQVFQPTGGRG